MEVVNTSAFIAVRDVGLHGAWQNGDTANAFIPVKSCGALRETD